jgi:hypothetical protein
MVKGLQNYHGEALLPSSELIGRELYAMTFSRLLAVVAFSSIVACGGCCQHSYRQHLIQDYHLTRIDAFK